jgi:uncharacterized repeat protein (TIGR03803 family)
MRKGQEWVIGVAVMIALATGGISARAQAGFGVLHSFTSTNSDGATPEGQPLIIGSNIFGVTYNGGSNSDGSIYQISTNGTGFTLLYSFLEGPNGANPLCTLVSTGSTFYGMTFNGGVSDGGVVFGLNTNGAVYSVLHTFLGGESDGLYPFGSLAINGTNLYGMTANGGTNDDGVIFSISTSGTNFTMIHSFAGGTSDGEFPNEGVIVSGSTLYGTAFYGGSNNLGIVFAMNTAVVSNGFTILHHFAGGTNDGANPAGPLTLSGSTLYGITTAGGTNNLGAVFKVNTGGTGYTVVHEFAGGTNDGASAEFGPLVVTNSLIYGTTEGGGTNDAGVLFQMNLDGTDFSILHSFSTNLNDGAFPAFGPAFSGSFLYGVTLDGGSNGLGVVYGAPATNTATINCSNVTTNVLTQISAIQYVNSNIVITVPTVPCQMYQLEYSNALIPTNWIDAGSAVAGTGSPIQFVESINGGCSAEEACVPPPSGLVSWWPGDGNTLDIVGGHNGVLSNSATYAAGEVCEAFSFNGSNDVVVPNNPLWDFGANPFTIELWVNFNSTNVNQPFISCDNGGGGQNKWIFFYAFGATPGCVDCLTFHLNGTPGQLQIGNFSFPSTPVVGQWYHVAVTHSGSAWTFYVDGSSIGTATNSAIVPVMTAPLTIGNAEVAYYFDGLEDEVSIYTNALSPAQIQSIYSAGAAGKCKPTQMLSQRFYRVQEFP